jgi:hypothetical protein
MRDWLLKELQESVYVVGRIVIDVENTIGPSKLNESTLTLESSRAMGAGVRVPLRFDSQVTVRDGPTPSPGGAGFFPGAIVALRGKNGGAGWFQVEEILTVMRYPLMTRSLANRIPAPTTFLPTHYKERSSSAVFSMCCTRAIYIRHRFGFQAMAKAAEAHSVNSARGGNPGVFPFIRQDHTDGPYSKVRSSMHRTPESRMET